MRFKVVSILLTSAVLLAPASVQAANPGNPTGSKTGRFARQHPRRWEVNKRIANQRSRIGQGLKGGQLTGTEGRQLRADDRAIKNQEHADVKANGGHLTKPEEKQLNQEENATSRLIHDERHPAAK